MPYATALSMTEGDPLTVIVSLGRHDRSPCGTGISARLAVMHARDQIAEGETFVHDPSDPFPTGFRLGDLWAPS
jgi:proline racemase